MSSDTGPFPDPSEFVDAQLTALQTAVTNHDGDAAISAIQAIGHGHDYAMSKTLTNELTIIAITRLAERAKAGDVEAMQLLEQAISIMFGPSGD